MLYSPPPPTAAPTSPSPTAAILIAPPINRSARATWKAGPISSRRSWSRRESATSWRLTMNEDSRLLVERPQIEEGADINKAALDAFGKLLIQMVRDHAIIDMDGTVTAHMQGLLRDEQFLNL